MAKNRVEVEKENIKEESSEYRPVPVRHCESKRKVLLTSFPRGRE